jgi:hypothetical protein
MKFFLQFLFIAVLSATAFGQFYIQDMRRDSARADSRTGGFIEKAALVPGDGNLKITINVPSFQMTLWQNGKEVKSYPIGVGLKDYPIYIGLREASQLIWNPTWIPPDSDWVAEGLRGQVILPTDPRNPLGKMKIPLGYGYLIHQAKGAQDLGNLVSHGCVRVLRDDLYDLSEKIIAARQVEISPAEIASAKRTKKTLVAELGAPIPVELTYDTMVVEAGELRIYPDIYERKKNTVENLRQRLESYKVDASQFDDKSLAQMIKRADAKNYYAINLEKIREGNLNGGKRISIIQQKPAVRRRR